MAEPRYTYNKSIIVSSPIEERKKTLISIIRGPNITPFPSFDALPESYEVRCSLS